MAEDLPAWARDPEPAGELPDWAKDPERGVLERAGSAVADTFKAGLEHAGKALSPPRTVHKLPGSLAEAGEQLLDPETYKKGATEALGNLKDTGLGLLSPLTMTAGALSSGAASLLASGEAGAQRLAQAGIKKGAEKVAPEIAKKLKVQPSEEAYEQALPGANLALMAIGPKVSGVPFSRPPIPPSVPKSPAFTESPIKGGLSSPMRTKPGTGDESEAGQIIEKLATNPAKVQRTLENPPAENVAGSEPTTFQLTEDYGLGQAERAAKTRDYAPFHQREAQQNAARIKALQEAQQGGSAEDISTRLRDIARADQAAADEAVRLAEQRAWETTQRIGGQNDATTYGEVLRQELRNAEEAVRTEERALWEQVDPGGRLYANAQPLQELERSIYGVMPEGGAAEASLTEAEKAVTKVVQNYKGPIPYQELRDLRHLVNTNLREEMIAHGGQPSPAYARLSRIRQGIADMEGRAFDEAGVLDTEASQRLRAASTATRERAQDFGRGSVGQVLGREGSQGPYRVGEAAVPEKFIRPGAKGHDSASEFLQASPQSLDVFQDAVAASARREVINPDGSINPRKLEGWLKRYQDTLRAIDERDGGAFSQGLRNLRTAQETLTAAQERQAAVREANERGTFGQLLGSVDEADITRRVGTIFGGVDRVQRARELRNMVAGNPAAEAGLRRSVIDHITERFLGTVVVGEGQTGLRASMFQKFVRENQAVLRQIMSPEQVATLDAIALDLQQATSQLSTKIKGSSNTAQDLFNEARQSGMISKLGEAALHWAIGKKLGKPGKLVYDAITGVLAKGKDRDFERIQQMIDRAMLEPDYARQLLSKTRVQRRGRLTPAVPIGAADNEAGFKSQQKPLQAGGGVPAIGGTGGRSPGARETARAGGARGGTGQALQDGGEAREQQAATPVGGRERYAAALQGTPTGAGFNVGGGQQGKTKALKTPSREDIRRTLQSFGITGEEAGGFAGRQLGEVDSRAYGGGVDDEPGGERAPIHYDPGDDTTFGARFGQWDKTATGKSLPRDDEDADSSVMMPGDKMIDRYQFQGERGRAGYYQTRGMAEGGGVEDRWASLPESRNVEDRRSEEPLSPGQMIAGNQAFMGKYPSPYTRAPRRAATAQARADGGGVDDQLHEGLIPSTLLDETKKYLAEQIGGVEQEHEQQDPLEAAVKHSGAQKNPPGFGGSDEGDVGSFEAAAARTRRRAPVRAPDPGSLALSQGKVGWGDLARHKLEQGIKTVTAPGRAYKQGMTPDEEIEAAQGMAGFMGGARFPGVMAGKAEGSLGIFGGKGSKTADLDMMHRAMEMREKGVRPETVWNQTGWFRGPEGMWRYEIPDYEARIKPTDRIYPPEHSGAASRPSLLKTGELRDVIEHPEFERAYPKLMGMPASMELGVKPGGGYLPPDWLLRNPGDRGSVEVRAPRSKEVFAGDYKEDIGEMTPRRVLLHEMQHAVQQAEGFAGGANPNALPFSDRQIANMTKKRVEAEGIPWQLVGPFDRQKFYRAMRQSIYEKIAGEVEARNVERRRDITGSPPPPWKTQDVKRHNQLVFSDEGIAHGFKPKKGQKPFKAPEPYADGGPIEGEEEDKLPLPGQSRGLDRQDESLPALRRNKAGESLPGHILSSWGEGLAGLITAPKRAYTGELPPDRQVEEFGAPMGMLMTGLARVPEGALGVGRSARRPPKLQAGEIPAADRPVTRGHNRPPEELPPFPEYAQEYPPVGPPTVKLKDADKAKFPGETYLEKTYTPEAAAFMKKRGKIMKDMKKGYAPYFDPAERQDVDPSNYPDPNVDTLTIQPKKEDTFKEYAKNINRPATAQLLREAYDRGEKLGNAHDWYAMSQLEDAYVKELGEGPGRAAFLDEFAVPMAATTSGNDPRANFLMAHYLEYLRKQGEDIPVGHQFPAPVGGRRVNVNIRDYKAMRERGGYEGLGEDQPKMHNFARSFIGDLSHGVMDEQMAGGAMGHLRTKAAREEWAEKARHLGFGMLEKILHGEAAKKGLKPGNFQDVAWAGFKGESSGPMISQINDAIERTHRLTGMPREEIVRRGLIRKEIPIYGLTAAATPYLWGGLQQEGGDNSSPSTGQPPP